jgi:hypothetical protein
MLGLGQSLSKTDASANASAEASGARVSFSNTKSLSFDGVNDTMEFGSNPNTTFQSLLGADSFTMSYWMKAADIMDSSGANGRSALLEEFAFGPTRIVNLGIIYPPSHSTTSFQGAMSFAYFDGNEGGYYFNTFSTNLSSILADDTWFHVAYTSEVSGGTRTGKIYINGVDRTASDASAADDFSSREFKNFKIPTQNFNGGIGAYEELSLDEISFYNTALNGSQVAEIYNSGVPRDELAVHGSRLVGYWRLEDNGADGSANSNDFAITGATFSTSVPT